MKKTSSNKNFRKYLIVTSLILFAIAIVVVSLFTIKRYYIVSFSSTPEVVQAAVTGFDVSTAVFPQSFSVAAQDQTPQEIIFNTDGTKMYVMGQIANSVHEYDLSTAFSVSTAVHLQNFSVTVQETNPTGLAFNTDGTKMFILGDTGNDVNEYDLSTGFDTSTAVYSQLFSVATQETSPSGLTFNTDGTKMYVIGRTGIDVNEYDLSTGFNISTAVYSQLFSVSAQETGPMGLTFNTDGTKMFIIGFTGDDVNEYDLSTGFDVSTAVYSQLFSVAAQETFPTGITFNTNGTKMYITGSAGDDVNEYDLSTGFDISTAVYPNFFSVAAQETDPYGIEFNTDGTKMFILGAGRSVNEYDLSTSFDIYTAIYSQNFSVAAQETITTSLTFNTDGTKMYIAGQAGQDINEYDLSTGFDVSTAVYSQVFSLAAQETQPYGITFDTNGAKMFVVGAVGDDVNEYDLSTGFDVSTAVYSQNFSVAAQETVPIDIDFNITGTKMFIVGYLGKDINEYNLSTGFDISTAVYSQNFSVAAQGGNPSGVAFNSTGTKMFIVGNSTDTIYQYTLADVGLPTISTLSPLDEDTNISAISDLVITFDEAVTVGTGNITIKLAADDSTVEAIDVTSGQVTGTGTDTITINPSTSLIGGLTHYVQIDATAFDDASGNSYAGISDTTSWNFTVLSSNTSSPPPTPINIQLLPSSSTYCSSDTMISLKLYAKNTDELITSASEDFFDAKWEPFIAQAGTEETSPVADLVWTIDHTLSKQDIYLIARNFNGNKSNLQQITVNQDAGCSDNAEVVIVEGEVEVEIDADPEIDLELRSRVERLLKLNIPIATNTFIQSKNDSTIYFVTDTLKLKAFPDATTYSTYISLNSLDLIVKLPNNVISSLSHATQMLPKPGVVLVKIPSNPRVYTIDESYRLHYISSEDQASLLYGEAWSDYIIDMTYETFNLFLRNGSVGEVKDDWSIDMSVMKKRVDL